MPWMSKLERFQWKIWNQRHHRSSMLLKNSHLNVVYESSEKIKKWVTTGFNACNKQSYTRSLIASCFIILKRRKKNLIRREGYAQSCSILCLLLRLSMSFLTGQNFLRYFENDKIARYENSWTALFIAVEETCSYLFYSTNRTKSWQSLQL